MGKIEKILKHAAADVNSPVVTAATADKRTKVQVQQP